MREEHLPSSSSAQYISPCRPQFHMQIDSTEDFSHFYFLHLLRFINKRRVNNQDSGKLRNFDSLSSQLHSASRKVLECGSCCRYLPPLTSQPPHFLPLGVVDERRWVQAGQGDVPGPNLCASAARLLCVCLSVNPRETRLPLKVCMYERRAPERRVLFLAASQAECILGEGTSSAKRA